MKRLYTYYAARHIRKNNKRTIVFMHRAILKPQKGKEVDHKDGDGLNNQKNNLRLATKSQNNQNQKRPHKNSTSKYKGVSWDKNHKKWLSQIKINYQNIYLGLFDCEIEAANKYNQKARELFGEFACLNSF